jgi:hypothetical protein
MWRKRGIVRYLLFALSYTWRYTGIAPSEFRREQSKAEPKVDWESAPPLLLMTKTTLSDVAMLGIEGFQGHKEARIPLL